MEVPGYDLEKPIEPQIEQRMVILMCNAYGYEFAQERLNRIRIDAHEMLSEKIPAWLAFSEAIQTEIDMYGDPKC